MRRVGLGKGLGKGYKNILPIDRYIHSLSAKGVKSKWGSPYQKKYQETATCPACGKKFQKSKYFAQTYCSTKCAKKRFKKSLNAKTDSTQKTLTGGEISDEMLTFINAPKEEKREEMGDYAQLSVKEKGDMIAEKLEDLKLPDVTSIIRDDFDSNSGDIFINIVSEPFGGNYALGEDAPDFNMGKITRKVRKIMDNLVKEGEISSYNMDVPKKKYDSYGGYEGYDDNSIYIEYWV